MPGCLQPGTWVQCPTKGDARRPYPALCCRSRTADGGAVDGDGLSGSIASAPPGAPGGRRGRSQPDIASRCAACGLFGTVARAGTARLGPAADARRRASGGAVTNTAIGLRWGRLELSANLYARLRRQELPANPTRYRPIAASLNSTPEGQDGALSGELRAARSEWADNANSKTPPTDGDHVFRAPARAHRRPVGGGGTHSSGERGVRSSIARAAGKGRGAREEQEPGAAPKQKTYRVTRRASSARPLLHGDLPAIVAPSLRATCSRRA